MRKILLLWACLILVWACADNTNQENTDHIKKRIIPQGSQYKLDTGQEPDLDYLHAAGTNKPLVEVPSHFSILQILNINLDFDSNEEQILVLADNQDPGSPLMLSVVDFDEVRNSYTISWQGQTQAVNPRNFTISLADIVGDHNQEIIFYGSNSEKNQTLDVFRKTHSPTGIGPYYNSICTLEADGTIDIEKQPRSQAYKLGQKNGISFPIVSYTHYPDSPNIMDLKKTIYHWKYQANSYVKTKEEKILGVNIQNKKLSELFAKQEEAFEKFLSGSWFLTSNSPGPGQLRTVLQFDPVNKVIMVYKGDIIETYDWINSYKTGIPNSIYISSANQLISFIKKHISVYVLTMDTIRVKIVDIDFQKGAEEWNGIYQRYTAELQDNFFKEKNRKLIVNSLDLNGVYKNNKNLEISFESPYFTLRDHGVEQSGGFTVFRINDDILELKFIDQSGLVTGTSSYKVAYSAEDSPDKVIRHLTLTSGEIGISGFISYGEPPIHLEQTEFKDTGG